MAAKQQAVATLQKFFFEELARGADANGAAAQALLRLGAQRSATPPVSAPEPKPQEEANEDQGDQPAEAVLPCTPPRPPTPLVAGPRGRAIRVSNRH